MWTVTEKYKLERRTCIWQPAKALLCWNQCTQWSLVISPGELALSFPNSCPAQQENWEMEPASGRPTQPQGSSSKCQRVGGRKTAQRAPVRRCTLWAECCQWLLKANQAFCVYRYLTHDTTETEQANDVTVAFTLKKKSTPIIQFNQPININSPNFQF